MNLMPGRHRTTGREIDPRIAVLTGEGAQQRVSHRSPREGSWPVPLWQQVPSFPEEPQADYYRLPLLKEPVWIWTVPLYFFVGGVAGGSAVLAAFLQGKRMMRGLAAACRRLAFLGATVSPTLLTLDLGRKSRFLNMLRIFRPTSPMSIGSWTLAGSGAFNALYLARGERRAAGPLDWTVAGGGIALAGYTGVLLGNTANPFWQSCRRSLPVLFTASAMASTAGVLELLPFKGAEERVVSRFGTLGKLGEAAGIACLAMEASGNPIAARSMHEGKAGFLWRVSGALLGAGIVLGLIPVRHPLKRIAAAACTTTGALCLRFALVEAGKHAAREPQAVIAAQR